MNTMKTKGLALITLVVAVGLSACQSMSADEQRYQQGKALYEDRCKNVAGEKIYRTVADVEGVLLMKIPPKGGGKEWQDPMYPGAAFSHERAGADGDYISAFLWYEAYSTVNGERRAGKVGITTDPTDLPGYRYVDVIDPQDGTRYRFSGRWAEPWQYDKSYSKGYIKFFLEKKPTTDPVPRYGVIYEDHVIPEERALGLSSGTVKVIDLQTQEVLGELTRYAWAPGRPSGANPSPWLSARRCGGHSQFHVTRFFVDQVLIPRK